MSAETDAITAYVAASGVPYKVTSTTGGTHAPTSYHYVGLAVDFAGPTPGWDSNALLAVYKVLKAIAPQTLELFYSGPGGGFWKNGRPISASASIVASHHNHVHVAVPRGFRWAPPAQPAPKEPIVVNAAPVALLTHQAWGKGYTIVTADGGVFNFGGSPFFGSLGNVTLNKPIIRAAVTDTGQGYLMLGADGGVFCFGDATFDGAVQYDGS